MKLILFGATGMIGQGVLRECLLDPEVDSVLVIGRKATGQTHVKLRELILTDMSELPSHDVAGYDACLFCLGVSSAGMSEADYRRVTYDMTLDAARVLLRHNPEITFIYVSGASTDSTEKGPAMWARVKGKTENDLLAMPFKAAYMFRPGYIQPVHGIRSSTRLYRVAYAILGPLYPLWKALFPKFVTTTEELGRAMVHVAKRGADKSVLEVPDIHAVTARAVH